MIIDGIALILLVVSKEPFSENSLVVKEYNKPDKYLPKRQWMVSWCQ